MTEKQFLKLQQNGLCWKCAYFHDTSCDDFDDNTKSILESIYGHERDWCKKIGFDWSDIEYRCQKACLHYDEFCYGDAAKPIYYRENPERFTCFVVKCKYYKPMDYSEYLSTNHWKETKKKRLEMDGFKCQICGSAKNLNVHHLTYESIGFEEMLDLVTVCKDCHEKLHEADIKRRRVEQ